MKWLGIDTGGTFTDLVLYDEETGALTIDKVPSTPHDPSAGILAGIARLNVDLADVAKLAHGTTVATNTILERKGAPTAVLDDQRLPRRPRRSAAATARSFTTSRRFARRRWCRDRASTRSTNARSTTARSHARSTRTRSPRSPPPSPKPGIEAVAICFLHAYANEANERAARRGRRGRPARRRCLDLVGGAARIPRIRAFRGDDAERLCRPRACATISARCNTGLGRRSYRRDIAIMTSNGGAWPLRRIVESPIHSVLSGPGRRGDRRGRNRPGVRLRQFDHLRHGWNVDRYVPDQKRRVHNLDRRPDRRPIRSGCSRSTSTASAPARGPSPRSTQAGRSPSARGPPVRCRGPQPTARVAPSRP